MLIIMVLMMMMGVEFDTEVRNHVSDDVHDDDDKGSHPPRIVQFFLTLFKRPLSPPPFFLNICPILQGVFFKRVFAGGVF